MIMNINFTPNGIRRALGAASTTFGYTLLTGVLLAFAVSVLGRWGALAAIALVGVMLATDKELAPARQAVRRAIDRTPSWAWKVAAISAFSVPGAWLFWTAPLGQTATLEIACGSVALVSIVAGIYLGQFWLGIVGFVSGAIATLPLVVAAGANWAPNMPDSGSTLGVIYVGFVAAIAGGWTLVRYLPTGKEL